VTGGAPLLRVLIQYGDKSVNICYICSLLMC
jgi:hypothetical protein